MNLDAGTFYAFFLVFVRCSGFCLAAPMFGSMVIPVRIRVCMAGALAFALTFFVKQHLGAVPQDLVSMVLAIGNEAVSGLLIGAFFGMVMQAATIAGAFCDLQLGLSMGQALNPISGIQVSVIGQFKTMLCLVVFLAANGHHMMLGSLVESYNAMPTLSASMLGDLQTTAFDLFTKLSLLSLQIAMPVIAVSLIVDAGMALINKAVPQMQIFVVGMPVKSGLGMIALSVSLPAMTVAVQSGVEQVMLHLPFTR